MSVLHYSKTVSNKIVHLLTLCLLNFTFSGWKRELVYRKTDPKGGDGTKRTGDIYYYTPAGKKVRSRVEILEHC